MFEWATVCKWELWIVLWTRYIIAPYCKYYYLYYYIVIHSSTAPWPFSLGRGGRQYAWRNQTGTPASRAVPQVAGPCPPCIRGKAGYLARLGSWLCHYVTRPSQWERPYALCRTNRPDFAYSKCTDLEKTCRCFIRFVSNNWISSFSAKVWPLKYGVNAARLHLQTSGHQCSR